MDELSDVESGDEMIEDDSSAKAKGQGKDKASSKVYLPGQSLEEGEELVHDSSAYVMYHAAQTGAPCLSFDILKDTLGDNRTEFPMTASIVLGTQTEEGKQNFIILARMSNLLKVKSEEKEQEDSDDDDDSDDEVLDDEEPQLDTVMVQHPGTVNRLRVAPLCEHTLVATWSERGVVSVWECSNHVILLDSPRVGGASGKNLTGHKETPLFSFRGHKSEGYALDWSPTVAGRMASGDCQKNIFLWEPTPAGAWQVQDHPFSAHSKSVEDIQWSPNEASVFASCSVDHTIRVWDCRAAPSKACMLTTQAHSADVNVISWNRKEPLIVSGGDDGVIKVWDLRQFSKGQSAAVLQHHSSAITSVEWNPHDSSVFASAGEDDQVVQWDLGVEADEGVDQGGVPAEVPEQLLFIHQGQREIKELHWHPQLPGVLLTTALNGFNVFKTISV